jgi:very-short-patch-repair endonuclease
MKIRNTVINSKINMLKAAIAEDLRNNMTPAESVLWKYLRANKLAGFHFRRQQVIKGFIADFYCHEAGLLIELDGEIHKNQKAYDYERDKKLAEAGYNILRFKNKDITENLNEVLAEILETCRKNV